MSGDATSTQALADQTSQSDAEVPQGPPGGHGGVLMDLLAIVGVGFQALTELEMQLTAPLGAIPFPGLPALRVLDAEIGLPHGHYHPPNLIPPIIPVPLPLPSVGLILPIPWFSGAQSVFIDGLAAARCGDMGVAVWCGSFFPLFEVFLGSCNVWVEGARAGRVGVDITTHCIFAAPKPQDPPCYPWIGFPITASGGVLIGGVPLPSLVNWAIGKAFEALFSGVMAVVKRIVRELKARVAVFRFLRNVTFSTGFLDAIDGFHLAEATEEYAERLTVTGDDAFRAGVRRDLLQIARTDEGRRLLNELAESGQLIDIRFEANMADWRCSPAGVAGSDLWTRPGNVPMTPLIGGADPSTATHMFMDVPVEVDLAARGTPTGSTVFYDPSAGVPQTPSDVALYHELTHSSHFADGSSMPYMPIDSASPANAPVPDSNWASQWHSLEEYNTVAAENAYRAERGLPLRPDYATLPGH